ncbi:MAG: tetratricopeptide repeat protein [Candidatus Brocadiae bacterium]|nr:tetratricopeptide repeat protein [Candidatus Brocadiia bacterium]
MIKDNKNSNTVILFTLVFLTLASFSFYPLQDSITLEHLSSGRHIHTSPFNIEKDPSSFLLSTDRWQNPYWLSDFFFYAVFSLFGEKYLWIFSCIFCLPFFFCWEKKYHPSVCLGILLLWISGSYIGWKPGIFYFYIFFALLFQYAITQFFQKQHFSKIFFFILLVIQTLWCQSHPTFFFGPLACLFFLLDSQNKARQHRGIFLLFFLISPCFSPPFSWENFYAFVSQKIDHSILTWPFFWIVLAFCFYLYSKQEKKKFSDKATLFSWAIFSCFDPSWSIAMIGFSLYLALSRDEEKEKIPVLAWKTSVLFPIAVFVFSALYSLIFPVWASEKHAEKPWEAAKFLQQVPENSPIFHDSVFAPYILWLGRQKFFLDRRSFLYPESLQKEVRTLAIQPQNFDSLERRFALCIAFLDIRQSKNLSLLQYLSSRMNWHLVYCDSIAAIFLRSEENASTTKLIEKYKIYDAETSDTLRYSHLSFSSLFQRARAYLALNLLNKAQSDIQNLAQRRKTRQEESLYHLLQGKLDLQKGMTDHAIVNLRESWRKDQENPETLKALLQAYLKKNSWENIQDIKILAQKAEQYLEENPEILLFYAQILYLSQKVQEARNAIQKIVQFHPEYAQARAFLSRIEKEMQSQSIQGIIEQSKLWIQQKRYKEALALLEKALQKETRLSEIYSLAGEIHLLEGNYNTAASCFKESLRLSPGHLLSATRLAVCIAQLGDWESALKILLPLAKSYQDRYEVREALLVVDNIAISSLKKALEKQFQPASLESLVNIWERREEFQMAIHAIENSKKQISFWDSWKKRLSSLYFQEGKKQIQSEKPAQGLLLIQKSIDLDPDFFECHLFAGTLELKRKDWEKARFHFESLQRIAPLDERGKQGLSLIELGKALNLQLSGEYEQALQKFQTYLDKAPSGPEKEQIQVWIENLCKKNEELQWQTRQKKSQECFEKAVLFMQEKKWEMAVSQFTLAIENSPDLPEAYLNRGKCYLYLKQDNSAKEDFQQAFSLKHIWPQAHFSVGYLYSHLGNYSLAKIHLEQYLQQDPQGQHAEDVKMLLKSFED